MSKSPMDELESLRAENEELRREVARHRDEARRVALDEVQVQRAALLTEAERIGHMGSWLWDPNTGETHASDELYRMFGRKPGEPMEPAVFFSMIHPEDVARVQEASAKSAMTGISAGAIEFRARLGDGRVRLMRMDGAPIRAGDSVRFVGAILDVTEIRHAEEQARRAASALNEAQRLANVGSWCWEVETGELEWSDQLRRILGLAPDTPPSVQAFLDRIHADDRERCVDTMQRISRGAEPEAIEYRVIRPDGELRHVLAEVTTWRNPEGKVVRMLGTLLDATERRALEERLRLSQKMEALGRLAGGVAHDFNNYLQVVSGNAEMLGRLVRGDERASRCAGEIGEASQRCTTLTRQLLAFARKQPSAPRELEVDSLLFESASFMRGLLGSRVALAFALDARGCHVRIDPAQLEQIFLNLAINARDAMPDGGALTVTTSHETIERETTVRGGRLRPGKWLRMSMRDEGTGIADDVLGRMFDPFFTTKEQGTGLGLSTVYGIVESAGGALSVRTARGTGTTFDVYLPAVSASVPGPVADATARLAARRLSLLLVEDELALRRTLHAQLVEAGFEVVAAEHAERAFELLDQRDFDLVLTDLRMPQGSGVDVARHARTRAPRRPVMAMTGDAGSAADSLEREFDAVLFKPFVLDELLATIERVRAARMG
jgi:PAS domain S-box-containing protein